jgi:AraC-like DNA-binding protein
MALPHLHLMDVRWNVRDDLVIHESNPSQTIDINFVLEGNIKGTYRGLHADLELRKGTSNLKFTPSQKSSHHAAPQNVGFFAIALEKRYFQDLIGCDNAWAEGIQRKLENDEDFFGWNEFHSMTPKMHAAIHSIRNMQPTPMTRIMTQSLVFELIAQQIEQLTYLAQAKPGGDVISANDMQKLYNAKQFIEQHFLDDITLTGLCREVMLNEFKLKKGFKSLFKTSVMQHVRHLRMEFAQSLLRDNRMTVEEVSGKVGYRYPNHFTAAYKKHFGIVPSISKAGKEFHL